MVIKHRRTSTKLAHDEPITELFLELPSGRVLHFASMADDQYDSDDETELKIAKRKLALQSMLDELVAAAIASK